MRILIALLAPSLFFACTRRPSEPTNTLHIALAEKVMGFDPIKVNDDYSRELLSLAYEGLLQYKYLGDAPALEPLLAEGMPEVSPDGRTYTLHLKKGVFFQDDPCFKATKGKGRELMAEDFVYSIKRLASSRSGSVMWPMFDGKIEGLNEWRAKSDYGAAVEGIRSVDRYTVRIELTAPSFQFPYLLASPAASVVPREAVEAYGDGLMQRPVGTGPYRLSPESRIDRFVWDRNPSYRLETFPAEGSAQDRADGLLADAGKPLPLNDRVVAEVMVEDQTRWLNFLGGKLDLAIPTKDGFQETISPDGTLAPALREKGIRVSRVPTNGVKAIMFNMADPVLGRNRGLRQALSLAFDSAKFIELFYNGFGLPIDGPIAPGLPGYSPSFHNPYAHHDLARAKRLLADAGFPGGRGLPPIEFAARAGTVGRQMAEFVQRQFAAIGVQTKIDIRTFPTLIKDLHERNLQSWLMGEETEYPDSEGMFRYLYGKNSEPGPNHSNYVNPAFDKLYEQALAAPSLAERAALYRRMQEIVAVDCPWIYVAQFVDFQLQQKWVRNAKFGNFRPSMEKYLRIDAAARP